MKNHFFISLFDKKTYSYDEQNRTLHSSPFTAQKTTLHVGKRTLSKQGKLSGKLYQITQKKKM